MEYGHNTVVEERSVGSEIFKSSSVPVHHRCIAKLLQMFLYVKTGLTQHKQKKYVVKSFFH